MPKYSVLIFIWTTVLSITVVEIIKRIKKHLLLYQVKCVNHFDKVVESK